jgi:sugar (pentulose or hexulose) kinase
MKIAPRQIFATGGGANDRSLLQTIANVLNCRVQRIEVSKSAALGAALQAAHGYLCEMEKPPSWKKLVAGFSDPIPGSEIRPDRKAVAIYNRLIRKYAACERSALA